MDTLSGSLSFANTKVAKVDHDAIAKIFAQPTHLQIYMQSDTTPSKVLPKMFPKSITTIVLNVDGERYEYKAKDVLDLLDWWMEHRDDSH